MDLTAIIQFLGSMIGAGTVGGLISGELNRRFAVRADRKRHLGCLLSDLLEFRHRLFGISDIGKMVGAYVPGQEDQLLVAIPAVYEGLWTSGNIDQRYESAVSELAALDPVLAYELRSKNLSVTALPALAKMALQNPDSVPMTAQAFRMLGDLGASVLDEAILRVGKELDRKTHRRIRELLQNKREAPQFLNAILALIPQAVQAAQHPQAQTEAPQPASPHNSGKADAAKSSG